MHASVQEYYTQLKSTADLKTSACCAAGAPPPAIRALIQRYALGAPTELGSRRVRVISRLPAQDSGARQ